MKMTRNHFNASQTTTTTNTIYTTIISVFLWIIILSSTIPQSNSDQNMSINSELPPSSEPDCVQSNDIARDLPGLSRDVYSKMADVNLGALANVLQESDTLGLSCSQETKGLSYTLDSTEAIAFAVELVNADPNLLPNVTLGFVLRGVCAGSPNVALATSLSFLPRSGRVVCGDGCQDGVSRNGGGTIDDDCDRNNGSSGSSGGGSSSSSSSSKGSSGNSNTIGSGICSSCSSNNSGCSKSCSSGSSDSNNSGCSKSCSSGSSDSNNSGCSSSRSASDSTTTPPTNSQWHSDDVIGLVSPDRDILTTMISSLYSVARLPVIGTSEVGDDLSNKDNHPYFFRVSPPSKYKIKAMIKFFTLNNWSYISILYQEGHYGQNAYESMSRNVEKSGICIATSHMLDLRSNYDDIVADLLRYPRARVVVLFTNGRGLRKVLTGVKNNNASGHFIFVAGDLVGTYSGYSYVGKPDDPAIGIFVFDIYLTYVWDFYEFLSKQRVETTRNPWLRGALEYIMECSYDKNKTEIRLCQSGRKRMYKWFRYRTNKSTSLRMDAVLTFAHAVHNLLQDKCPEVVGKDARSCITGPLLREYIKNVSFDGFNGRIRFDEHQDVKGKYGIGQFAYDHHDYPFTSYRNYKHMVRKNVAVYDVVTDSITYNPDVPISWSHVNRLERIVPLKNDSFSSSSSSPSPSSSSSLSSSPSSIPSQFPVTPSQEIPESVCSRPCVVGEYKIQKDVSCCWECRRCRDNERLVKGSTGCQTCPLFTWPDLGSGFTKCVNIPPSYPSFDDVIPITLTVIAILCITVAVIIFIAYIVYRHHRVIKASSRELSLVQLAAILSGYVTVILFQTTPTDVMCGVVFFLFCMSFALLYCPLLVKTIRIIRIFQSGARNEKPRFISPQSQLVFAFILIAIQAVMCATQYFINRPRSKVTQPIWTEKYVELSCDLTFLGMTCFLTYNILQVFLCSVFAFKVRRLPDNFNESKFISTCVSTTLLIWLAFVPTYFTADRQFVRAFLLSTSLVINHSVALLLLFAPKIYAAMFLDAAGSRNHFSNNKS